MGIAVSQGAMFALYALAFWFGGRLVEHGKTEFVGMMKVIRSITWVYLNILQAQMGVMFGAMIFSQLSAMAPDYSKAKVAAFHIFQMLDRNPPIDVYSSAGTVQASKL